MKQELQDVYSEWLMVGAEAGYKRDLEIRKCPYREGETMIIFTQSNMHNAGQGNRITLSRVFHTWGQSTRRKSTSEEVGRLKKFLAELAADFEDLRNSKGENYISGLGA
jgi:hypothetical protein